MMRNNNNISVSIIKYVTPVQKTVFIIIIIMYILIGAFFACWENDFLQKCVEIVLKKICKLSMDYTFFYKNSKYFMDPSQKVLFS